MTVMHSLLDRSMTVKHSRLGRGMTVRHSQLERSMTVWHSRLERSMTAEHSGRSLHDLEALHRASRVARVCQETVTTASVRTRRSSNQRDRETLSTCRRMGADGAHLGLRLRHLGLQAQRLIHCHLKRRLF